MGKHAAPQPAEPPQSSAPKKHPKPPKPPAGCGIRIDLTGGLAVGSWSVWPENAMVYTIDNTGTRVTLTRVAMLGVLALAAKKKSGTVSVVIASSVSGASVTHEVKAKHAQAVMTWAVAFNAWQQAVAAAG
jgi:hypothetical protein